MTKLKILNEIMSEKKVKKNYFVIFLFFLNEITHPRLWRILFGFCKQGI